ncbi:MAG: hypothetical protein FWG66_09610 [Spirochaetes bacterium]|nr:hypothetical protein [Spirochaetota bacterium]
MKIKELKIKELDIKGKSEKLKSPLAVFLLCTLVAFALVMCFRFIFPASVAPLPIFARDWRVVQSALEFLNLFPAVALSALVIPFSLNFYKSSGEKFSAEHFKRIKASLYTALCAALLYAGLFFFVIPSLRNMEDDMFFRSELYNLAVDRAVTLGRAGHTEEALRFVQIGQSIWPESQELERVMMDIGYYQDQLMLYQVFGAPAFYGGTGQAAWEPLTFTQAINASEAALEEGRYFDAHWLATAAGRLAIPGSPEAATAARVASLAWNQISLLAPDQLDVLRFELFHMKLAGYMAMNAGDWIRAFFIFQELLPLTPTDADVVNFLALSETRANDVAFFLDEMHQAFGQILTGAVFSLPGPGGTRSVMRFSSLTLSRDIAYAIDFEYIRFDAQMNPTISFRTPYAKLLPVVMQGNPQVMVQTRAIDRNDPYRILTPEFTIGGDIGPAVFLDIAFDDFMLLSAVRRGFENLQINELFAAANVLGAKGYAPEVFQAEILNRLGAMFFLPVSIFVILMGWRLRPQSPKLRYFFVLLFPLLPIVFHALVLTYRSVLNNLGIFLTVSLGFTTAAAVFGAAFAFAFLASLILLTAQRD